MNTNIVVFGTLGALAVLAFLSMQNANAVAKKKAEAAEAAQAAANAQPKPARTVTAGELSEAVRKNMQDASLSEIAVKFYDPNNK